SSADMSHKFFEANDSLLDGGGPLQEELEGVLKVEAEELAEAEKLPFSSEREKTLEGLGDRNELYMSVDDHVSLVNVLPDGKLAPGATFGGEPRAIDEPDAIAEYPPQRGFAHAISRDGSRVFWSTVETGAVNVTPTAEPKWRVEFRPGVIYVRENGSSTVQVSQGPAQFWNASPDGRYVFYVEAGKLWRFDLEAETRVELAGSSSGVQGVIGTNETGADGAYVYFVSQEALAGPANAAGDQPVAGQNNLYVYEPDPQNVGASRIMFVASLSAADNHDWESQLGGRLANVTPDGHGLVFVAHENLTSGFYPGEDSEQVYVYDTRDGSLFCASCSPQASGGDLQTSTSVVYEYRRISEDGDRVFFESTAPLVAQDVNGVQDVYEWERDGSGPCHESDGCVYLLSDGLEGTAWLIDASVSGDDVFMVTRQRLVPGDGNENADVYDARVDGVRPVAPPQCTGTGCQGAPAQAPIFATPSSATFNGVGNFTTSGESGRGAKSKSLTRAQKLRLALATCHRKRQKRKRVVCEVRAHKLYGNKAKRSTGGTK
ncbi:MAG: TolB family protein, partial [Solirubrobacteraceae bacterium]